jgi:hypothetical protein
MSVSKRNWKSNKPLLSASVPSATRSTQAKSREKQLEKIERIEAPTADLRTLHFRFPLRLVVVVRW